MTTPNPHLAAVLDAAMNGPGFIRAIGARLVRHAPGEVELALTPRADLLQFMSPRKRRGSGEICNVSGYPLSHLGEGARG